jgi:hypothetical protein
LGGGASFFGTLAGGGTVERLTDCGQAVRTVVSRRLCFTAQKAGDCYEPNIDVPTIGRRDGVRCSGICRGHLESGGDQFVADDSAGETDDETLHGSTEG